MTLIEKGQKSALSPDETAIFERLNRTELYQLVRRAGIAASPRQTNEQLIALLVGTSNEVSSSPYDDMRAAVFAFVDENWLKIKSQLSCPAKARHPRACYGCVDAKAVHCIVGSPNMELYLSRVRDQKKDTPMPAPTSPLTTYTVKTAPRDAASLALLTSFNLKNLFKEVHKELGREYDGAAYSSFLTMARPQQTQSVLQLLAELDGGAKAKPKTKAKAPPPPPVAQEEDDEEEESDEDEDEDEEPEADDTDEGEEEEEEEEEAPKAATKVRLASTVAASTAGAAAARAAAQARAAVAPAPAPAAKAAVGRPRVAVKAAPAPAPAAVEAPAASAEVLAALTELQADVKVLKETQEQIQEQIKALSSLPLGMQSLLALMLSVSEKVHKTDRASVLGLMNFDNVDDLMTPAPETQELEEPAAEEEEEPTEEEEEEEAPPPPPPAKGRGKSKGKA